MLHKSTTALHIFTCIRNVSSCPFFKVTSTRINLSTPKALCEGRQAEAVNQQLVRWLPSWTEDSSRRTTSVHGGTTYLPQALTTGCSEASCKVDPLRNCPEVKAMLRLPLDSVVNVPLLKVHYSLPCRRAKLPPLPAYVEEPELPVLIWFLLRSLAHV